ncbi:hypothetical protein NDU88_007275 [Pleurodeles waltl]|uniref:Uncharacterized protein n=1 Tax=Pleurodeles waltl TaxID=8319 RepID=A0AAV7VTY8_PLEWA|nr:hypothetical protein NDU88_007275 [Pleurodeles waltl]
MRPVPQDPSDPCGCQLAGLLLAGYPLGGSLWHAIFFLLRCANCAGDLHNLPDLIAFGVLLSIAKLVILMHAGSACLGREVGLGEWGSPSTLQAKLSAARAASAGFRVPGSRVVTVQFEDRTSQEEARKAGRSRRVLE